VSADLVANALVLGSVYLMFASGFTLVYGTFQVMNLAHGTILTLGGFLGLLALNNLDLPLPIAVLAAAVGAGTVNVVMDALVVRPIKKKSASYHRGAEEFTPVIATLAFSLVIAGIIQVRAVDVSYTYDTPTFLDDSYGVLGATLSVVEIAVLVGAAALAVGMYWLIDRTRIGVAIRAVAEDSYMASALGVRSSVVSGFVFFLSGALAGVTGVAVGILYSSVNPSMGVDLLLFGFVIVTVGGLGSLTGTALAAYIVAFARTIASDNLSGPSIDLWVFSLLLITLVVRPAGLLGKRVLGNGVART
jgi:branched-chain amino acid transport system permease protein